MIILGITGMLGAGKGAVVEYLVSRHGFTHYSARSFIEGEIRKRNLPIHRDSMVEVANDLRHAHGPGFIINALYQRALEEGSPAVIESIRTPGEIEALKKSGNFYLIAVDADQKLRYERIVRRGSSTDDISFEQFVRDEEREMKSDDPSKQNLSACVEVADFTLYNNGSLEELYEQIEEILKKIRA